MKVYVVLNDSYLDSRALVEGIYANIDDAVKCKAGIDDWDGRYSWIEEDEVQE